MSGSRGSKLQRAVDFFREASIDEARATYTIVQEVMTERLKGVKVSAAGQAKAASTPRKKRRTKAQMAADKRDTAMAAPDAPRASQDESGTTHIS